MGLVIRVTRWRVFVALAAAVALFVAIGSFTVVYTATPGSCLTCHTMVPFYESWEKSAHHEVACVDCHYPPGVEGDVERELAGLTQVLSYMTSLTATGARLQAQVPDRGCLASGCHQMRALRKPLLHGRYVLDFRHDLHVGLPVAGIDLKCTSCHMRTRNGEHFTVNPETCWVCHFYSEAPGVHEGTEECLECHGMALRLNRDMPVDHTRTLEEKIACQVCHGSMVEGKGPVSLTTCRRCHIEGRPEEMLEDPETVHRTHTQGVKIDCSECHDVPRHESRAGMTSRVPSCETCHPRFHEAQAMVWSGKGFPGVPARPNPMVPSGLTCEACHMSLTPSHGIQEIGETKQTTAESCRVCHPDEPEGDFAALVPTWRAVSERTLSDLKRLYDAEGERFAGSGGGDEDSPGAIYRAGFRDLDLLAAGGPVHNVWYARDVMRKAFADLERAVTAVDPDAAPLTLDDPAGVVPEECRGCHFGVQADLAVFGDRFSHVRHTVEGGVGCFTCHTHRADGHGGTRIESPEACSACHHDEESRDAAGKRSSDRCAACHPVQTEVYEGRWERPRGPQPNVMAASVHCVACHFPPGAATPIRPGEADCRKCHPDADLASLLPSFRKNIAERRTKVEELLPEAGTARGLAEEDRAFLDHVRRTLEALEADGSGGIHNPALVDEVLSGFVERLRTLVER